MEHEGIRRVLNEIPVYLFDMQRAEHEGMEHGVMEQSGTEHEGVEHEGGVC